MKKTSEERMKEVAESIKSMRDFLDDYVKEHKSASYVLIVTDGDDAVAVGRGDTCGMVSGLTSQLANVLVDTFDEPEHYKEAIETVNEHLKNAYLQKLIGSFIKELVREVGGGK